MFRKIRDLLIFSAVIAVVSIVVMVMVINNIAFTEYRKGFIDEKRNQFSYFIEKNYSDMNDLVYTHAVWSQALERIVDWDDYWLYENATGYIVDEEIFNIDVMYISDEYERNHQEYGDIDFSIIRESHAYKDAINGNRTCSDVIWYNEKPLLIVASPFFDNDNENPKGCYLVGRYLDDSEIEELKSIISTESFMGIDFFNDDNFLMQNEKSYDKIDIKASIVKSKSDIYASLEFKLEFWKLIFMKEKYYIIAFIVLVSVVVVSYLSMHYKRLSLKMNEVIEAISRVSTGNYHVKVENKKEKMMPELEVLIDSVNKMSHEVEKNIALAESHALTIDKRYVEMIHLLVTVVEMNDSYTYHHSFSVAEYALMIGRAIGFEDLENLELASKLHDVGKIAIPSDILNKPGKLTDEEYELIKTHSEEGYKLLNSIEKFAVAKYGVLFHHERFDGNGYPNRMKGEEIPMIAQIIAVADVFDAVTSDRSYRKAMSYKKAMEILNSEKGKMLNPSLVDVFHQELLRRNPRVFHEE